MRFHLYEQSLFTFPDSHSIEKPHFFSCSSLLATPDIDIRRTAAETTTAHVFAFMMRLPLSSSEAFFHNDNLGNLSVISVTVCRFFQKESRLRPVLSEKYIRS